MSSVCRSRPAVVALVAVLSFVASGCGDKPVFNTETRYTPESLAQELVFRYNALSPAGKTSKRTRRPQSKAVDSKADEKSPAKAQSNAATKKELPKTVDDILDDIEAKFSLINGMSQSEIVNQMIDAISQHRSLGDNDRKTLTAKLKELGGG